MTVRSQATFTKRSMTFGLAIGAMVVLMLSLAAGARAAGEFELNDTRETAYGPLAGATWYTATIETENDVDWYLLYIRTYSQMDFSATMVSGSCGLVTLYNKDGREIEDFYPGAPNEVRHLLRTLNAGRYYLEVDACTNSQYKFRVDPAASITTSRECGEAIVARDAVGPQLAEVNEELAKNAAVLATKAAAVHEAKGELRRAGGKASWLHKRLQHATRPGKRRHIRFNLRRARNEMLNAQEQLDEAKEQRAPVWKEKQSMEALVRQYQQQIATANGQIAISC